MQQSISSKNHQVIKKVRKLSRRTFRDREGLFMVEGSNLMLEAVKASAGFREIIYTENGAGYLEMISTRVGERIPAYRASSEVMNWISDVVTSQGIIGVIEQVDTGYDELVDNEISLLVVAENVRDPGNMGSLIRIADAVGADGFVATSGCVDLFNPKVVRSAAGSHFHLSMVRNIESVALVEDLKKREIKMVGLDTRGETSYLKADLRTPLAVVLGNEAYGLSEEMLGCAERVSIPMPGRAESLNVAAAAAVVLFEALRQRG